MNSSAGSLESSDCLITISDSSQIEINIESIVINQFGDKIKEVIEDTLKKHNINNVHILCQDKGALDYTIIARLETALIRRGDLSE